MKKIVIAVLLIVAAYTAFHFYHHRNDDATVVDLEEISADDRNALEQTEDNEIKASNEVETDLSSAAHPDASVTILEPADGAVVSSPLTVRFGISNMQIAPAGTDVEFSGHHHLLIDMQELPDLSLPLPATEQLIHFGGGQTEATIELSPGPHTLQLILGNYLHVPHHTPVMSETISIVVE